MVTYLSKYAELSFYVSGRERKFSAGTYEATTAEEVAVLDRLVDAIRETTSIATETPEEPAEALAKPAPKPRKPAAKANASE